MYIVSFYLPCSCVSPEIGKLACKPVVDLIESQLSVWGLQNGLRTERRDTKQDFRGEEHRWRDEMMQLGHWRKLT